VIKVHFRKKTLLGTIGHHAPSLIIWGRPLCLEIRPLLVRLRDKG
jgi:hypothetical protein